MPYANYARQIPLRRVRITPSGQLLTDATRLANALSSAARAVRIAVDEFQDAQPDVDPADMPVAHGSAATVEDLLSGCDEQYVQVNAAYLETLRGWVDAQECDQ